MGKMRYSIYGLRAGLTTIQIRLGFGKVGVVDGYGNTLACDDTVRIAGEEAHSVAHNWVKGLVDDGEWVSAPDHQTTFAPVTKTATGTYTLRFDDTYLGLSGFKFGVEDSANTKRNNIVLVSFTVSDATNDGRSSCIIRNISTAGAAADPDDGSYIWLEFALKTSEQG
jgi:hypothetical protein